MRWIKKKLYERGYRPKRSSIWFSPTLSWAWGVIDNRKQEGK